MLSVLHFNLDYAFAIELAMYSDISKLLTDTHQVQSMELMQQILSTFTKMQLCYGSIEQLCSLFCFLSFYLSSIFLFFSVYFSIYWILKLLIPEDYFGTKRVIYIREDHCYYHCFKMASDTDTSSR